MRKFLNDCTAANTNETKIGVSNDDELFWKPYDIFANFGIPNETIGEWESFTEWC